MSSWKQNKRQPIKVIFNWRKKKVCLQRTLSIISLRHHNNDRRIVIISVIKVWLDRSDQWYNGAGVKADMICVRHWSNRAKASRLMVLPHYSRFKTIQKRLNYSSECCVWKLLAAESAEASWNSVEVWWREEQVGQAQTVSLTPDRSRLITWSPGFWHAITGSSLSVHLQLFVAVPENKHTPVYKVIYNSTVHVRHAF